MYLGPTSTYTNSRGYTASGGTMSGFSNNSYINKNYLMEIILNQLNLTPDDLDKDPSFIKSKIREHKLNLILEDEYIL